MAVAKSEALHGTIYRNAGHISLNISVNKDRFHTGGTAAGRGDTGGSTAVESDKKYCVLRCGEQLGAD
jgi:hypothetical protein